MALNASKKRIFQALLIAAGILFVCAYFAGVSLYKEKQEKKREAPIEIVTFSGLPEEVKVSAEIIMSGKVSTVPVVGTSLKLTAEQIVDFSLPYTLKASFQFAEGEYRDITWTIDARGVEYSVLADGFSPDDKMTLILDGSQARSVSFDWSGRMELPIILIPTQNIKVCTRMNGKGTLFLFCHYNAGLKST